MRRRSVDLRARTIGGYNPAMLLAALALASTGFPQDQDPLDEPTRRAAATTRLRAVYELTLSSQPGTSELAFDYLAPDRMRLEIRNSRGVIDSWIIGTVLSMRSDLGERPVAADLDMAALVDRQRAMEARIREVAPALTADWTDHGGSLQPVFQLKWGHDGESATFEWKLGFEGKATSPFGWLETARQKDVTWSRDGDLLRAETDGCFAVALATSGLLHELSGRTAKGSMKLVLRKATFDEDPPADRFVVPPAAKEALAAGGDVSRVQLQAFQAGLRLRLLKGHESARTAAGADAAAMAQVDEAATRALREYFDFVLAQRFVASQERLAGPIADLVQQIVAKQEDGMGDDAIAKLREEGARVLTESLGRQRDRILGDVRTKDGDTPAQAAFIARERAVLEDLYRERVVDVLLARYKAACDEKLR